MKSILIIGMGMLGQCLATRMQELGNDVMVIDRDEDKIQELSTVFPDVLSGDCNNFDYCFVAIGEDFYASLEITSILKEQGARCVISKAKRKRQADFLKKIGADEVFFPEKEIAEKLAVRYNATNIFDYIELTSDCSIFEIPIIPSWAGKSILEINVRQKYKVNIIAIKNGTVIDPMPAGNYVFGPEDQIVVIGKSTDVFQLSSQTTVDPNSYN